jgi:hypothetical protein
MVTGAKPSRRTTTMTTACAHVEPGSERAGKPVKSASLGVERIGRGLFRGTKAVRMRAYVPMQGEGTMRVTCGAARRYLRQYRLVSLRNQTRG